MGIGIATHGVLCGPCYAICRVEDAAPGPLVSTCLLSRTELDPPPVAPPPPPPTPVVEVRPTVRALSTTKDVPVTGSRKEQHQQSPAPPAGPRPVVEVLASRSYPEIEGDD